MQVIVLGLFCVALSLAYDRVFIKRPIPKPVEEVEPPQGADGHPEQYDNGSNYGCVPDRNLIEACVVKHQHDTKQAYQCYGASVKRQAPSPDPCFSDEVTAVADKCYEKNEFGADRAFKCLFRSLGLPEEGEGDSAADAGSKKKKDRY